MKQKIYNILETQNRKHLQTKLLQYVQNRIPTRKISPKIKKTIERTTLTRFRLSNHKLLIELGRYQKIPRKERLCNICQSGEVEDEHHFANPCEAYRNIRENFRNIFRDKFAFMEQTPLADIMKSSENEIILYIYLFYIIYVNISYLLIKS